MNHRRIFLKQAATLGLGSVLFNQSVFANGFSSKSKYPGEGLQLYTLFGLIDQDVEGYLEKIAKVGYKEIESAFSKLGGYYGMAPRTFAAVVKDKGMTWRSHHVIGAPFKMPPGSKMPLGADGKPMVIPPMKNLRDNYQELIDEAAEGGITYLVCASTPIGTLDEVKASIEVLNIASVAANQAGLQFAYHNHDREFKAIDGVVPYDLMLSQTNPDLLKMELDLAWAMKAGKDPIKMFQENKGRFHLWHVKDLDKNNEKVLELGKGSFDFKSIFDHAKEAGMKYFFVEQDGAPSPIENITTSYQYIHKLLQQ